MTKTIAAPPKVTPWAARAFEVLADGPLPRRNVVDLAIAAVPPARAAHQGAKKQRTDDKSKKTDHLVRDEEAMAAALVRKGAMRIVLATLDHQVKMGRMALYEEDGRMMLRLTEKE